MRIVLFLVMMQQVVVISYHCLLRHNPEEHILGYFAAEACSTLFCQHVYSEPSFFISVTWG